MTKINKLISVDKKQQKYLKTFNVDSLDKLSLDQGNQFFIKIIKDFKDYKLTLDELAVFGSNVFHGIAKKYPKSDLFQTSLSASDLSFCIRSKETFKNTPLFLSDIEDFLIKHK